MDAVEILDQLTHAEGLPKAALQVASAQRVQSLPSRAVGQKSRLLRWSALGLGRKKGGK